MKLRPILFWSHLTAGVVAGLVVLMMSATGVLLTYERQIIDWVDQGYAVPHSGGEVRLTVDELVGIVEATDRDATGVTLTIRKDPNKVVKGRLARNSELLIDPYTGGILRTGDSTTEEFFSTITQIHRWFAMTGDSRATGRAITGYSNLLFLFLLLTGTYLWLPRVWNRVTVRTKIFFNPKVKTSKSRDYNWHHVFSFWALIPLFFVIVSATVFYYPWANKMVYAAFGEEAPERRRSTTETPIGPQATVFKFQQELLDIAIDEAAARQVADWKSITMQTSTQPGASASFSIDRSIGGQPANQFNLKLDGVDGSIIEWQGNADNSPGRRARIFVRFLHTGEVFGFVGQTLAGLASLAACLLVWTGLALAWRRLISPLLKRRAAAAS